MSKFNASIFVAFVVALPIWVQATDLPFETDFEGPEFVPGFLSDTFYSGSQTIQVVDDIVASGDQSLEILRKSTVDFELNDLLSVGIRWVDFYVKPVFSVATDLPEMIAGLRSAVSAFVVQGGQGLVYVVHGDGSGSGTWVSSGNPVVLEDNKAKDWMRMSYRLDYGSKTWDLYLDDRLVLFDLGFLDHALTRLDALSLQSSDDRSTHVDFLYVGMENPLFADQDNDGIDDRLDAQNNQWKSFDLPNPATQWSRYTIYFDYTLSIWSLYQDEHLIASQLPFANPSLKAFDRFFISIEKVAGSSAASYLDNLKVYSGPDFDADGLDFDVELANGFNPTLNDRSHPEGDFDLDGFKNGVEWRYGTHHLFNYAAENAALQVDTRIKALESASSLRFFTQQDHSNKAYVRNPEVWCNDIDSITAISPWNSTGGRTRAGTLISPQHLLFAAHYQLGVGASVRFVTKDNQLVERTVIARKTLAGYSSNGRRNYSKDITIGLLNEPLHADIDGIHFVKVLPEDWADYLGPMDYSSFDSDEAMPALCLDYEEKALITDVRRFSTYVSFTTPALEPRRAYYESKIVGDSGNPALLLLNSQGGGAELVLLNVWTFGGAGSGASVYENKAEINQIMADLETQKGFKHGDQLTEYDFSGFQALGSL